MRINNNIAALRAMGASSKAESRLEIISRRLSSGVRIASAKDDSAGMSVSEKTKMQIGGTKVATQNSLNGISLVQTAEAALNEVHSILQRMRELTVESANDTLTSEDRMKVQTELRQLAEEIDAIAVKTEYNKGKLLNGHCGTIGHSSGAKVVSVTESVPPGNYTFSVGDLGVHSSLTAADISTNFPSDSFSGDLTINGITITINGDDSGARVYEKVAEALDMADISIDASAAPSSFGELTAKYAGSKHTIELSSTNPSLLNALGLDGGVISGTDAGVSLVPMDGGFTETSVALVDGNRVTTVDPNGRRMVVDLTAGGTVEVKISNNALILHTGANQDANIDISIGKMDAGSLGIDRINCTTVEGCAEALRALDFAIGYCSDARTRLGSYVNRMELTNTNLDLANTNLQSTLSKIYDTDMAYEIAELSKQQIAQQAGMAILVQANQRPQQILQLLS